MIDKNLARRGKQDRDPIRDLLNALTSGMSPDPLVHDSISYVDMVQNREGESPERLNFEPETVVDGTTVQREVE